ncbi:flagellin [Methylobacterium isbiliense]|uniref:flagellin N-terminal helical domain-containing protein n=4 Tax=Methylobacterium isbiliense TaxID=315478 RepID=UPI0025B2BC5D|nr:flagellin [Methylobacterium isbiliense]MDN3621856.1 flagellin [Methylobacterium isbiliense]
MTSLLANISAMTALTTLKGLTAQLDITSNRVSTGQRVSAAADNAAYWSIATAVRTDNASLGAVKDSLGLGSSSVDTAYNGLNSVISDLQNLRAKLQTALQPGTDRSKVQTEITAIQNKMKATADSSVSNSKNWLSVDSAPTNSAYQATEQVVAGFSRGGTGTLSFSTVAIPVQALRLYDSGATTTTVPATPAQVTGRTALAGTPAFQSGAADFSGTNEVALDFTVQSWSTTIRLNQSNMASAAKDLSKVTRDELLSALNNRISASFALAGIIEAGLDDAGRLQFTTLDVGAAATVSVGNSFPSAGHTAMDIGIAGGVVTQLWRPVALPSSPYTALDLSGSNTRTITIDDGQTSTTVTLGASSAPPPADITAVTNLEVVAMLNTALQAQGSTAGSYASTIAATSTDYVNFYGGPVGPTATLTISGPDAVAFGFVSGYTINGTSSTTVTPGYTASGSNPGSITTRGLLDTVDGSTGMAVGQIAIAGLVGTAGDATLRAIITQVDKAIAAAVEAGTTLGAIKTRIDGQMGFIDTLMKANGRTVGTLVDADIEEESTKLKALQTQQQLAIQALSIANSGSQTVLALFR